MKFMVITLFPDVIKTYLSTSMMWKATEVGAVEFTVVDLREFGIGPRRQVDDAPYGGGDGMLLKPEPVFAAVKYAKKIAPEAKVVLPTPKGRLWTQEVAREFSAGGDYIVICPHYEGYDERITTLVDEPISMGRFILTGGELPALSIIDSVVRLIPGVLGGEKSAEIESFSNGDNLEFPQYTRPEEFQNMKVPEVLLSGNHGAIAKWREKMSGHVND